uniref:Protein kinase domain-containing protein n=1 Tax=Amphimedon queenslandica TaxID=400682 RepID=A0A1X7VRC7_AMPQE
HSSVEQIKEFISESETMLRLDHPNVLKLLGVCFDTEDQLPAIVLPFMANGDLKSFLVEKRGHNEPNILPENLSMEDLLSMCLDIARGMNYLSEQKFVHRDLAARNCIDERLPILVLIVSGLLTVSDCQEDILQDIVTNVSMRASLFSGKMTDCSEFISLSNYNSTCESEVPYDNVVNVSVMVHFDWNAKSSLHKRCYCSSALLSLLIPTSVLTSDVCDNNENATIYCSKPCINESKNELACHENCEDLACFMYGKMPYIILNQRQLYILVTGINCKTIEGHATELCAVLFSTPGPTPTATNTESDLSTSATFSIIFVGIFLTCVCTIAAVCFYCTLRMKRKQKLKFQELQMKKNIYDSATKGESIDGKPAIDFLISSANQFANCIIPYSAIKITCELGEGAFGIVYKGKVSQGSLSEIEDVAIKTLK